MVKNLTAAAQVTEEVWVPSLAQSSRLKDLELPQLWLGLAQEQCAESVAIKKKKKKKKILIC